MRCTIADEQMAAFVTYLALGTLEAIRAGTVSAQVGIWTLGRPVFWRPLEVAALVPQAVIDVVACCDELSALQQLAPEAFEATVGDLIARLHAALAGMENPSWLVRVGLNLA